MLSSLPTPPPNSPFLSHKYTEYHETPSGDFLILKLPRPSLVAQLVKNTPAMQETPLSIPGSGSSSGEGIGYPFQYSWAFLVAQLIMNPPAMWETWVRSLGWEDPQPERERLLTPVFWPGEFPELYSPRGHKDLDTSEQLSLSLNSI